MSVAVLALGAGPAGASGNVDTTCPEVLKGPPKGGLHKESDPPDNSVVRAGQAVEIHLVWNAADFVDASLHKALDCVTVDGVLHPALSIQENPTDNDGEFVHRYTVPADLPEGSYVCDRGFVSGDGPTGVFVRQKSNDVCFTVGGEETRSPTATQIVNPGVVLPPPVEAPPPPLPQTITQLSEGPLPEPPTQLPHTGDPSRLLLLLAGISLTFGGAAIIGPGRSRSLRTSRP